MSRWLLCSFLILVALIVPVTGFTQAFAQDDTVVDDRERRLREAIKKLTPEERRELRRELKRRKREGLRELRHAPVDDEKMQRLHHMRGFVRSLPAAERKRFQSLSVEEKRTFLEQHLEGMRREYTATLGDEARQEFEQLPRDKQDRRVMKERRRRDMKRFETEFRERLTPSERADYDAAPKDVQREQFRDWMHARRFGEMLREKHGEAQADAFMQLSRDEQRQRIREHHEKRRRRHGLARLTVAELESIRDWDGAGAFPVAADRIPERLYERLLAMPAEDRARKIQRFLDHPGRTDRFHDGDRRRPGRDGLRRPGPGRRGPRLHGPDHDRPPRDHRRGAERR